MYCTDANGASSRHHNYMYRILGEIQMCGFRDMRADRQTFCRYTLHHYQGKVMSSQCLTTEVHMSRAVHFLTNKHTTKQQLTFKAENTQYSTQTVTTRHVV